MRLAGIFLLAGSLAAQNVTPERLNNALKEQQNWLTYWGDYSAIRHRDLKQITTENVKNLRVDWIYQTGESGSNETMPPGGRWRHVRDRVGRGIASALSMPRLAANFGATKYAPPAGRKISVSSVNRGMAILGNNVYMVTPDSNLLALDARTGRLVWQSELRPWVPGMHYATLSPLVVKDKIIVGISGGEQGVRGFIDAYDRRYGQARVGASGICCPEG